MRLCPRSMKMISGMMAMITMNVMIVRTMLPVPVTEEIRAAGRPLMMLLKMMSDMPLPTPRWVMTSPSHMMRMAPTTMVKTTMNAWTASGTPVLAKVTP